MDRSGSGRESREDKGKREGESRHGRNWALRRARDHGWEKLTVKGWNSWTCLENGGKNGREWEGDEDQGTAKRRGADGRSNASRSNASGSCSDRRVERVTGKKRKRETEERESGGERKRNKNARSGVNGLVDHEDRTREDDQKLNLLESIVLRSYCT